MIAKKYGCTVEEVRKWNNLKNNTIYPKQKLRVGDAPAVAATAQASNTVTSVTSPDKVVYYTVKKGDTLWDIAQQYRGVSVDDIKKWNNLGTSKLYIGQKLKIHKSS